MTDFSATNYIRSLGLKLRHFLDEIEREYCGIVYCCDVCWLRKC